MTLKIQQVSANSNGVPVLLIHGWAMNSQVWQPVIKAMPEFTFYTLDLPGHGVHHNVDLGHNIDDWCAAAVVALNNEGIEVCHLAAWSLGGALATKLAEALGPQCCSLSLISSNPKFVASDDWPYAMPVQYLQTFMQNLQHDIDQVVRDFMELQVRGVLNAKSILTNVMAMVEQGGLASEHGLANGLAVLQLADLRMELRGLACPIQFILGKNDTLVPSAVRQDLVVLRPDADIYVISRCGHAPFVSHTDDTVRILSAFLEASPFNA